MKAPLRAAGLIGVLVAALFSVAHGQTTIINITKLTCARTSDTTAEIAFPLPTLGNVEVRFKGPTGTLGVWAKVQERFKVDITAGLMQIHVDKLRADLAYRFDFRLRTPNTVTDPVTVICPLPTLILEDGAIDFKKFKGPYRFAPLLFNKEKAERSFLELEWPKNSAKEEVIVDLEAYPISAAGKFFKDERADALRSKYRARFTPEKRIWTGQLEGLWDLLRKTQKADDLKKFNVLVVVATINPEKQDPLEMCRFISDLKGKVLLAGVPEDFEGVALATLVPVRFERKQK